MKIGSVVQWQFENEIDATMWT